MVRNKIILNQPVIENNTVKCTFSCTGKIDAFFKKKEMWVQYNREIDKVPGSILVIPILSNILPIAWAFNTDIYLDEVDSDFLESSEIIKKSFRSFFRRQMKTDAKIYANSVIKNKGYNRQKIGVLFSGGVDSVATYIRRREENPSLITIWGADIGINNEKGWEVIEKGVLDFGSQNNSINLFIKSNFREMIRYNKLQDHIKNWWGQVQHGYALIGLCAPISYSEGMHTICIPATMSSKTPDFRWGSHPLIDNNIKWGETSAVHEGYELTRQDKFGLISEYIKTDNPLLQLRVCYKDKSGQNCNKCEKCSRTIIGFILEGVDPNQHGFKMNNQTLENIKTSMLNHKWVIGTSFQETIRNVPLKKANVPPEYEAFFSWLETVKITKLRLGT